MDRLPSEMIKGNPQSQYSSLYIIAKFWIYEKYLTKRIASLFEDTCRKRSSEMVKNLLDLLATRSTYFLDEFHYHTLAIYQI